MKREVGIWIDHRKTVIVSVTDKGEETILISSDMEKHYGVKRRLEIIGNMINPGY